MKPSICFAFSIHKSGSTLFYNLLNRAMHRAGELGIGNALRYVSISDQLFNAGVPETVLMAPAFPQTHNQRFDEDGTLYGGFRFVPAFATNEFLAGKRIMVLVRDPRDVLTSLYFSQKKSHRVPVGEGGAFMEKLREQTQREDVDEFALRVARRGPWAARFARITEIRSLGASWRYEDVVFEKARWLDEILAYLEIDLPKASRDEFVRAEDIRPDHEDADKHIRQVTPGDHKRKLRADTIDELNHIFCDTLEALGYF